MFIAAMQTVDIETRPQADASSSRKPLAPNVNEEQRSAVRSLPAYKSSPALNNCVWCKGLLLSHKISMNSKHQENGALSVPLILTLPASNSVAILRPAWLKGSNQTAGPAKLLVCEQSIISGCITERTVKLNSKFVQRSNFNSHQSLRLNS
jgi:hypothetical protein